jgi:galactose mutarotase-like enzyme
MIYTISNGRFRLSADDLGAELASFAEGDYEYIWQRCDIWNGQSPLLFPIVGRLREDTYELNGKSYTLAKHGFARKSRFTLESHSDCEMTFLLRESESTLKAFPYPFELRVHFYLTDNGFVMEHSVTNTGKETMYFSMGAHPGFQCEMGDKIVMDEPETASAFRLDENALRGPDTEPVLDNSTDIVITPTVFAADALIFDGLRSKGCTLRRAKGRDVHVDFGGAPCLGLWAKPGAPYVCIEPWYGIDDRYNAGHDFTKKERICSLEAGETFVFPVTVTV